MRLYMGLYNVRKYSRCWGSEHLDYFVVCSTGHEHDTAVEKQCNIYNIIYSDMQHLKIVKFRLYHRGVDIDTKR